jgi:hypothetical protein
MVEHHFNYITKLGKKTLDAAGITYSFFQVSGRYYCSTFAASALIILFSELLELETLPKYIFLKETKRK